MNSNNRAIIKMNSKTKTKKNSQDNNSNHCRIVNKLRFSKRVKNKEVHIRHNDILLQNLIIWSSMKLFIWNSWYLAYYNYIE